MVELEGLLIVGIFIVPFPTAREDVLLVTIDIDGEGDERDDQVPGPGFGRG